MFTFKTLLLTALATVGIAATAVRADNYYSGGYSTPAYPTYSTYSGYAPAPSYVPAYRPPVIYVPAPSCPPPVVVYRPAPPVWQPPVIYRPYEQPRFVDRDHDRDRDRDHDRDDGRFRINFRW